MTVIMRRSTGHLDGVPAVFTVVTVWIVCIGTVVVVVTVAVGMIVAVGTGVEIVIVEAFLARVAI
jgi:hypothetical protein